MQHLEATTPCKKTFKQTIIHLDRSGTFDSHYKSTTTLPVDPTIPLQSMKKGAMRPSGVASFNSPFMLKSSKTMRVTSFNDGFT
jgi:hypothetical protein